MILLLMIVCIIDLGAKYNSNIWEVTLINNLHLLKCD